MEIFLNEHDKVKDIIDTGNVRELGIYRTAVLLLKYYLISESKKKACKLTEEFLLKNEKMLSGVDASNIVERAVKTAQKSELVNIESIPITQKEIDIIESFRYLPEKRSALALLCVGKYYKIITGHEGLWVWNPDDVMVKFGRVKTGDRGRDSILREMRDRGLIRFSKKVDSLSIEVLYGDDEGEPVINVTNMKNLWNFYMSYKKPFAYYSCKNCGCFVEKEKIRGVRGAPRKYCSECAEKVAKKQVYNAHVKTARKARASADLSAV